MFFGKQGQRRRLAILASAENKLRDSLRPLPKVWIEVYHQKKHSIFLVHQKRGVGEEDLYSVAWMKIIWTPEEKVLFSTRKMAPEFQVYSTDNVYGIIRKITAFLEERSAPAAFTFTVGE